MEDLRLDGEQFYYLFSHPQFGPMTDYGDYPTTCMHGVWSDVKQIKIDLVRFLFAAANHEESWLLTATAQAAAGAFAATQLILNRFHDRLQDLPDGPVLAP